MAEREKTYLVTITILEGRHYIWENMNSAVIVRVDNKKKCTAVKKNTDCPFYNEYFVFEMESTYEKLMEKTITITVIQPKTFCRRRKILGIVKLDIATVLNQKNSQFYHKWAVLASPKSDVASSPTGYLKVDIGVLSRGQTPKLPTNVVNDEIEGNLLTPTGFVNERQRAQFIFDIYKCENLQSKSTQFIDFGPNKTNNAAMEIRLSSFVEITFAGITVSTTVRKNTQSPVFNERVTITDLFPPLCQRVKIEICLEGLKKTVHSRHYLNLKSISNDTVEGFLPTFGPSYIFMYSTQNLEGYAGTILMSMRTELLDNTAVTSAAHKANVHLGINPYSEEEMFTFEEIYLFATIFEANCISKKYHDKPISFRLTFGNITSETEIEGATGDGHPSNVTVAQKPLKSGKNFYYMNYAEEKPCLRVKSKWPDFRKRMYNSNMLGKMSKELKLKLAEIEKMFVKHSLNHSNVIEEKLKETMDFVFSSAKKYIEILSTNYHFDYGTILDQERINMCLKIMNRVLERIELMQDNKSKKFLFRKIEDIQRKLESLVEDAQACWPDIFLWMTCSNKKVGFVKIPARDVVFSQISEEMGVKCGKIEPILFMVKDKNIIICKIEILLWLGLEKQKQECFSVLPKGFKFEGRLLIAEEKHVILFQLFEGRAHIFEGEVQPGFDVSGLVDAFVQVAWGRQCKETQIKKHVLVPLWDQMLLFNNIYLYGTKEHIRQNPPTILLQMFDADQFKIDFIGRDIIKPEVTFLEKSLSKEKKNVNEKQLNKKIPNLKFFLLYNQDEVLGEVLAAFELNEISTLSKIVEDDVIVAIPTQIKPHLVPYKIEVMFWGVRHLKKINLIRINRPRVTFYCANRLINSDTIENAKKSSNFTNYLSSMDVNMPSQTQYSESFIFKMFDSRKFGIYVFAGISISDTTPFLFTPIHIEDRLKCMSETKYDDTLSLRLSVSSSDELADNWETALVKRKDSTLKKPLGKKCLNSFLEMFKNIFNKDHLKRKPKSTKSDYSLLSTGEQEEDEDDFDWWTKFYASMEAPQKAKKEVLQSQRNKLKIYPSELENQPDFKGFSDILTTFEIFKGKRTGDEALDEGNTTAIFKGTVKIYRWPPESGSSEDYVTPAGTLVKDGVLSNYPNNSPVQYVLRVYCVRAIGLRPKDLNGKSDPYIEVWLGDKLISDRENYIPNDVNPIFGRCFEFQASFPEYTSLTIKMFDYDLATTDDLIGETTIDIENRFYTKHRASCGIAESYFTSGYCKWRDQKKPSEILNTLCKRWGTNMPEYGSKSVSIGFKTISPNDFRPSNNREYDCEVLALAALNRWQEMPVVGFKLVPEHVETRSLFAPDKPGIEQGKIQLWIDILPKLDYPVPEKVIITPRKPISYELRVVIWNTEDVALREDDFFTGEKKSDIYVKGWLDDPLNPQYTDVHYRSLTGEGNFNWRFIFPFDYLSTENKLVIKRKQSVFSRDESELKIPCVLNLTVWDNDTFSKDEFLGSLTLELSRMPRGARSANKCNSSILDQNAKKINLFKIRRTKGWWPFKSQDKKMKKEVIEGKLEAELEILTIEEAEKNPAGMGRQGPQSLPPPKSGGRQLHYSDHPSESHYDEELPKLICHGRLPFADKCIYCKGKNQKECKVFLILLVMTITLLLVVLGLYFGGYIDDKTLKNCLKMKRESPGNNPI